MGEVFGWPDGVVSIWTGNGSTSALVGYATETTVFSLHGAENFQSLDGSWNNVPTGRLNRVTIGGLYSPDSVTWFSMASAETAVHMELKHDNSLGSAGVKLWSGYIDSVEAAGREGDLYRLRLQYHSNIRSAY